LDKQIEHGKWMSGKQTKLSKSKQSGSALGIRGAHQYIRKISPFILMKKHKKSPKRA
jgi:hypothetical protein